MSELRKDAPSNKAAPRVAAEEAAREVRILIVDDHAVIRQGVTKILARIFPKAVFGEADNGNEGLEKVAQEPWDVVMLDITMPGASGLQVLKQIVDSQPNLAVLVMSMHPEDEYAVRALKAGTAGYLIKTAPSEEVIDAVKQALAGGKYVSASIARILADNLSAPAGSAPHERLSDREYQVMKLIALGRSVKEIAFEMSLSAKTISTYRARIMEKTNLKTTAEIIRYAMQNNLVE